MVQKKHRLSTMVLPLFQVSYRFKNNAKKERNRVLVHLMIYFFLLAFV